MKFKNCKYKRKILLTMSMLVVLLCLLALSAGAEAYDPKFGETEYIDDIGITARDVIHNYKEGESELARIKVACICEKGEHTYPTYYFMSINVSLRTLFNRDYARMNEKNPCGATYDKNSVIAVEIPEGVSDFYGTQGPESGTFMGNENLVYVKFPSTFSNISILGFKNCTKLEWVDMSLVTKMTTLGASTFNGCVKLKGICLPDQIKGIGNAAFIGCYELGPVYLPASLETVDDHSTWPMFHPKNGNATDTAPFCTKMYFTNEKFDNPDEVEKPTVYYMPTNLTRLWAYGFRGMANLNDVIVFGESYTNFNQSLGFTTLNLTQGQRKTFVFTADMTGFSYYATNSGVDIYFVNANDNAPDSITFSKSGSGSGDARMYMCGAGVSKLFTDSAWSEEGYAHIADISTGTLVPADCFAGERLTSLLCYCGVAVSDIEVEGSLALGHILNGNTYYEFFGFTVAGKLCVECTRNGCTYAEKKDLDKPIFVALGYSFNEFSEGDKYFVSGYKINDDMLALYEKSKGVRVGYGVAFNSAENFTADENGEITLDSFVLKGYAKSPTNSSRFGAFEYKVTYDKGEKQEEALSKKIIIALYAVEISGDGAEVTTFINRGNGEYFGFDAVSYNSLKEQQ